MLRAHDRAASPLVWLREHWPARSTFVRIAVLLLAVGLVVFAARWRRSAPPPSGAQGDLRGVVSIALVVGGWALNLLALSGSSSGGHDDVALGLAWMAIFMLGSLSCVLAVAGGALAVVTLRRDGAVRSARIGLVLAALTLAVAAVLASILFT